MGALRDVHGQPRCQRARAVGQEDEKRRSIMSAAASPPSTTTITIAMPATTEEERLYSFPPFPAPPEGATIVPFSAFVPAGYRRVTDPSGDSIEVDAWVGIPTVKLLTEAETAQRRKAKKRRRNAGNAVDAEGRLIPWWEEWEEGEALRAMSEPSFDRCGFRSIACIVGLIRPRWTVR